MKNVVSGTVAANLALKQQKVQVDVFTGHPIGKRINKSFVFLPINSAVWMLIVSAVIVLT